MYYVLRTIDNDGQLLTHLPTAERLVGESHENYADALANAKPLRTSVYRHRKTGEERVYSELATTGSAYREDDEESIAVWQFVRASVLIGHRGYALAVEDAHLPMYEPKAS